jgi:outer membrane protein OmpA-like peptidoglycan-associated protein
MRSTAHHLVKEIVTPVATFSHGSILRRKCDCGGTPSPTGECQECSKKKLQPKIVDSGPASQHSIFNSQSSKAPPIVHEVLRSTGQQLPATSRVFMEQRFGNDFSQVRVHTDARAAESARVVNALAYTVGQHVVFATGRFAPETNSGRSLLAHELAHTVQQSGNLPAADLEVGVPTGPLEEAAARASGSALAGRRPQPQILAAVRLQRQSAAGLSTPLSEGLVENASSHLASALGSATLEGFGTGSSQLTPRHLAEIRALSRQIVLLMRRYPISTVRIMGHTDTVGTETNNLALGLKRAEAVRAVLVAQGVPDEAIVTQSVGEGPPLAVRTPDNVSNARNRRAVIRFEPSKSKLPPLLPELRSEPLPDLRPHQPGPPVGPPRPPFLPPPSGTGTLPAPEPRDIEEAFGGLIQTQWLQENSRPHASVDLSSGTTSNAPPGTNPTVFTITLIWRNWNVRQFGSEQARIALDVGHEPNVSVVISPDPQNRQIYQAAITLLNLHLRRHGEDLVEIGLSAQGQVNNTGTFGGAAQAQVELHLTSRFSLTASTSIGVGPDNPNAPPDRGSIGLGRTGGASWTWTPFGVGTLVHF